MRTVVVLPAPFGPEEGVDLALGDLEVDPRDRLDPARELALEPCYLDCRHGGGIYRRAGRMPMLRQAGRTETRLAEGVPASSMSAIATRPRPALALLVLAALIALVARRRRGRARSTAQDARQDRADARAVVPEDALRGGRQRHRLPADRRRHRGAVQGPPEPLWIVGWAIDVSRAEEVAAQLLRRLLPVERLRHGADGADLRDQAPGGAQLQAQVPEPGGPARAPVARHPPDVHPHLSR